MKFLFVDCLLEDLETERKFGLFCLVDALQEYVASSTIRLQAQRNLASVRVYDGIVLQCLEIQTESRILLLICVQENQASCAVVL